MLYDRRQKKLVQEKWCTLVSHLPHQIIHPQSLPRRLTIYLAAPPGDGLRTTREHFVEYVKPVLVAGGMDWDVVEGRREGEVRAGTAERVRRMRRKRGDVSEQPEPQDARAALERVRDRNAVQDWQGVKGDIIIGRHTWKEYIRGLHEGWLGPMDPPKEAPPPSLDSPSTTDTETLAPPDSPTQDSTSETPKDEPKKEPEPVKKPPFAPSFNSSDSYTASNLPATITQFLTPTQPILFPHILGFFNTPIRMYRFLTRRHLADETGRQTAAAVMAAYRPFHQVQSSSAENDSSISWEQQQILTSEEGDWFKKATKRIEGEGERVWLDDMIMDPRIAERMRIFELEPHEQERADRIRQKMPPKSAEGEKVLEGASKELS